LKIFVYMLAMASAGVVGVQVVAGSKSARNFFDFEDAGGGFEIDYGVVRSAGFDPGVDRGAVASPFSRAYGSS
jgi:hypothetical protein